MDWLNIIIQGILLGGLYGLFAAGLSLVFGIMRLVNIAHGDFIVLGAFVALVVVDFLGLHPLLSLLISIPVMAAIGFLLQYFVLQKALSNDVLRPLLVTFGLSIIIQNGLLETFSSDFQKLNTGAIETSAINLFGGISIGWLPLITFIVAVLVIGSLQLIFYHTATGRAFRAVSDDPEIAKVMGLSTRFVYAKAMALAFVVVAIAGAFLAFRTSFDPLSGPARLIYGFEAVIIGGLGNIWGTLVGGIILGVSQSIGASIHPSFQILAGHIVFLIVIAFRPQGLLPKVSEK